LDLETHCDGPCNKADFKRIKAIAREPIHAASHGSNQGVERHEVTCEEISKLCVVSTVENIK
jgi:hypothetical protein